MRELQYYIGKPVRSLQTMLRVLSKTRADQPSVIPDGIFGADTARAVAAFQNSEGLETTGDVEIGTWNRLTDAFEKEAPLVLPASPLEIIWQPRDKIAPGERSLHMYLIQAMLIAIGRVYPDLPSPQATGVHDEQSVNAVKWMQEKCGRPAVGTIDQIDWLFLTKLYRITVGDGKSFFNVL